MDYVERLLWTTLAIIVLGVVGLSATCATTAVRRDRAFENACRKAGGYVGNATLVSGGSVSSSEVCLEVVQPPISKPIVLPNYTP